MEAELRAKDVAAFIVEPIQGRLVTLPPPGYLQAAQALCRRYGISPSTLKRKQRAARERPLPVHDADDVHMLYFCTRKKVKAA